AYTDLNAINPEGDIVAEYLDANSNTVGFLLSRGNFHTISFPGAAATAPNSINPQGEIVGYYNYADDLRHGFLLRHGRFSSFDFPGANFTVASAINARGQIVGIRSAASALGPDFFAPGATHGYLLSDGTFTPIDVPGAVFTTAIDINSEGAVVGRYN